MNERLVICPLDGDFIADGPVHQPAAYKLDYQEDAPARRVLFTERIARCGGVPPYEWPTRCGKVGLVYAHGGVLAARPSCEECAAVPEPAPRERKQSAHGDVLHYRRGCRCDLCREANSEYMRDWYDRRKLREIEEAA